jgi:excisionase family DNA binding protein
LFKRYSMNHQWITVRTAARLLGVSHNTVRARIVKGEIPVLGYVDGRIAVLDRTNIERLAERRVAKAA